ncbi:MAG: hypothetical protein K9M57_05820 [Phycisphaerae bacterium]|nr:hypothetical protein [Phycisphaerae bacterium]
MFETCWSKSSASNIILYNDPASIKSVAVAKDIKEIKEIKDARMYDCSSRVKRPNIKQIVILQNSNGFYAGIKILNIEDDTRGSEYDELTYEYVIQKNGTSDFTTIPL